jgi:predicted short-subunit dehydrogenase-like oxidoreductase (DUF2520 family)
MTASQQLCEENNLDFTFLHPLIKETFDKAMRNGPKHSQTGPAKRADVSVMNKHLEFLRDKPMKQQIYKLISEFITARYANDRS